MKEGWKEEREGRKEGTEEGRKERKKGEKSEKGISFSVSDTGKY